MIEIKPVQKGCVEMLPAMLGSAGLALVLSCAFAFLACHFGLLFSGISTYSVVLVTTGIWTIVAGLTALIWKYTGKQFTWRKLFIGVLVLVMVAVGWLSWLLSRQMMQIFMKPEPVPSELQVHHGRQRFFDVHVHFTAPPAAVASILQSKGMVEVTADGAMKKDDDTTYIISRERSLVSWGWWQPATMPNPRFFFRYSEGGTEGWWVNGATNEVYAFIGD